MDAAERELLRLNLLHQLDSAAPRSLRLPQLRNGARLGGFTCADLELLRETDYLTSKGMIEIPEKEISPEITAWKITATGRDFVAQHPLG